MDLRGQVSLASERKKGKGQWEKEKRDNKKSSGQSYKASTIVNYDSRVVPDWKIPHITILES